MTVSDAKAAQEAVAEALGTLKDFYGKLGTSEEAYGGMESSGVLGMLEVIQSDFGRLEAETVAAEAAAKADFEKFMEESKAEKALKSKMGESKGNKKQTKSQE